MNSSPYRLSGDRATSEGSVSRFEFPFVGVKFRATTAAADTFVYDPTYDAASSFGGPDFDAGRPVELFGVGTRNGITGITTDDASTDPQRFQETSPFSSIPGTFTSSRSIFAANFTGGVAKDVSNTVVAGIDIAPWAIGKTSVVAAGESVPTGAEFAFELDLSDADVANYVSSGMNSGELFFALTSLHSTSQTGPSTSPSFHLDADGASLGQTAQLDLYSKSAAGWRAKKKKLCRPAKLIA